MLNTKPINGSTIDTKIMQMKAMSPIIDDSDQIIVAQVLSCVVMGPHKNFNFCSP